jgi:putative hydrolase of the HAD superfamily
MEHISSANPRRHSEAGIGLVVFDLGGVIVRIAASWEAAHGFAGIGPLAAALPEEFVHFQRAALDRLQLGRIDAATYYQRVAEASEGAYEAHDVQRIHEAWTREEYEGFAAVFEAIESSGVRTALLSNTNGPHWRRLVGGADGAPEYPNVVRIMHRFASHELGLLKPDPAMYGTVASVTGIPPHRILFFDDIETHVLTARDAGWAAEWIDSGRGPAQQVLGALRRHGVVA